MNVFFLFYPGFCSLIFLILDCWGLLGAGGWGENGQRLHTGDQWTAVSILTELLFVSFCLILLRKWCEGNASLNSSCNSKVSQWNTDDLTSYLSCLSCLMSSALTCRRLLIIRIHRDDELFKTQCSLLLFFNYASTIERWLEATNGFRCWCFAWLSTN